MVESLTSLFPNLRVSHFQITSPPTDVYNCIAWAAGQTTKWWWPPVDPLDDTPFWPDDAPHAVTVPAFAAVFATLGYVPCDNDAHEIGWEKVALFADSWQTPTHAARQLRNGRWTSKLGEADDIEHELRALEGDIYGTVVLVLKRPALA
jgi:hypothetical protein